MFSSARKQPRLVQWNDRQRLTQQHGPFLFTLLRLAGAGNRAGRRRTWRRGGARP